MNITQKKLAIELNEMYVEYYNDFLTVERYASYKGMPLSLAKAAINAGRKINHDQEMLDALYS